jgi:hypothetical protein
LAWRWNVNCLNQRFKKIEYTNAITNGNYTEKTLEGVYQFSPAIYQLPAGSFVNLKGAAVDYYPDRVHLNPGCIAFMY